MHSYLTAAWNNICMWRHFDFYNERIPLLAIIPKLLTITLKNQRLPYISTITFDFSPKIIPQRKKTSRQHVVTDSTFSRECLKTDVFYKPLNLLDKK